MADEKIPFDEIDSALMQNLLKLSDKAGGQEGPADLAISRLSPQDRARALDLAATLIRQARREATAGSTAGQPDEAPPAKPVRIPPRAEGADERLRQREILFRGVVYRFKRVGAPKGGEHRVGVTESWETEIEVEGDEPFSLVVEEFVDGRFSPWSFEGVFFNDFVQAAIVGVVAGSFQAKWLREQWQRQQEHRRMLLVMMPLVAFLALLIGIAIGLRFG